MNNLTDFFFRNWLQLGCIVLVSGASVQRPKRFLLPFAFPPWSHTHILSQGNGLKPLLFYSSTYCLFILLDFFKTGSRPPRTGLTRPAPCCGSISLQLQLKCVQIEYVLLMYLFIKRVCLPNELGHACTCRQHCERLMKALNDTKPIIGWQMQEKKKKTFWHLQDGNST